MSQKIIDYLSAWRTIPRGRDIRSIYNGEQWVTEVSTNKEVISLFQHARPDDYLLVFLKELLYVNQHHPHIVNFNSFSLGISEKNEEWFLNIPCYQENCL